MSILTRPILEINLTNLTDNYKMLATLAGSAVPAAVIKDDAYGLGAGVVAKELYDRAGCRMFFAAHALEGQKIAPLVPEAVIYILQGIGEDSLELFANGRNLIPVISSPEVFAFWKEHKIDGISPAIQVETGLNRLGFRENDLRVLNEADKQEFGMVMSHLACADEKDHFMNAHQLENFRRIRQVYFPELKAALSASDGVFLGADFHQDIVRLGAAVYGINTAPYRPSRMKNVVTVKAPVLQTTVLPKGDFVGYSATYRASSERRIAIVSIGYGDGLPRSLSNTGKVFYFKENMISECRIIGRVSMDNIICDITNAPEIRAGDFMYLTADFYTLDEVALDAGTISYEIMSRLGKGMRFERKYIR